MPVPSLDPTFFTALHSLDFGEVQSPDGRSHPVDAMTPIDIVAATPVVQPVNATSGSAVGSPPSTEDPGVIATAKQVATDAIENYLGIGKAQHRVARIVLSVVAIGIIIVVAVRLTKP